jgi:hypothetical protein
MAIAPGRVSADPADTPDGERVIVPTSIYAPGTLVGPPPDADGPATGAPPHTGQPPGPGAGPAAGYPAPPPDPGMGQAAPSDYGPPSPSEPGYDASAHRPPSPPGEHPYGDYAYVIREEEASASRPARPRAAGPGTSSPVSQPSPQEPPQPEPDTAYGPDDPAYGPPRPGWYSSEDQDGQQAAEGPQPIRGVFEPLPSQGEASGTPPLEQIRNFYLTAEAISAGKLDRQFGDLLERQRQLISAYFTDAALQEDPR